MTPAEKTSAFGRGARPSRISGAVYRDVASAEFAARTRTSRFPATSIREGSGESIPCWTRIASSTATQTPSITSSWSAKGWVFLTQSWRFIGSSGELAATEG